MNKISHLSDKWIKSAILGTVWASSEIVLGSFLHNLRVPFSGNILTAIGIIILISAHYKWDEKGLFWRAGLVCALMKTMSPSAVIFGPMVAIFAESLLLEFSIRILGRTVAGFLLGAMLAMSWNLLQKIFNYIIFYGYNIVEVYKNLMIYAEKQLGLQFDAVWTPLLILLSIYALFGAFSALVGIRTGRRMKADELSFGDFETFSNPVEAKRKSSDFHYSLAWLVADLVFMISALVLVRRIPFAAWVVWVLAVATIWAVRYKRALRQLVRPRLWIFFILITLLTAFVFTRLQSEGKTVFDAILIGVEMNLRAIVLIMGFTVLGTELYHPKIRETLSNSYFRQLPLALELSVESLPMMIAHTPDLKTIVKNPFLFVQQIMGFADYRLQQIQSARQIRKKVFIVTGNVGAGKTTLLKSLIEQLKNDGISVGGFYQQRILSGEETVGYDLVEISSGKHLEFLRTSGTETDSRVGKYFIRNEVFSTGNSILKDANEPIVFVDEIGKMEMKGEGWAQAFSKLIAENSGVVLASFRKELLKDLQSRFQLTDSPVLDIDNENKDDLLRKLYGQIRGSLTLTESSSN